MTEVTPEGTSQINYTYDNLYRLTNETRTGVNPFTASYAYDINSNRTQKVETVNGITETINYEYNANDQLLSEVSSANGTTVYTYDVNGSLTTRISEGKFSYQYGYDLRNRLVTANITRKEGTTDVAITSSYAYNTDGIRTRVLQTINGITQNRYFLLDDGHTGYAQVFEETAELGGSIIRSYTIDDDVLSQTVAGVTSHLLYDGHGSTRQLADSNGAVTANYAYDAYGKMLGGNPGVTDGKTSATDLLYAGEQFDPGLQMEYLRARYYDQDNGRFNRLDPFEGNSEDPQSLHKYAYAHADPVNGIDPSGKIGFLAFASLSLGMQISVILSLTLVMGALAAVGYSWYRNAETRIITVGATRIGDSLNMGSYISTDTVGGYNWEQALDRIEVCIDVTWGKNNPSHGTMQKFKRDLQSGTFSIFLCDNAGTQMLDKRGIGAFRHGNAGYISRSSIPLRPLPADFNNDTDGGKYTAFEDEHILRLVLIAFCEYQHTALHGRLNENEAQAELNKVRNNIPNLNRLSDAAMIRRISHGGHGE